MKVGELFSSVEFAPADRARWTALANKALGGASYEDALISRTDDGLRIEPIYERAQPGGLTRKHPASPWLIVQRADDPDVSRAAAQIADDAAQGATGLSLVFENAPNAFGYGLPASPETLAAVLQGVALNKTHIRIDVHPQSRTMADWLVALMIKRRVDPSRLSLSFGIDSSAIFASTGRLRMSIEALEASMPQSLAHFFAMGVPGVLLEADGRVYHNAGATEAQELGIMLAAAVSYLRLFEDARQALVYAAPHIGFALSVDQDQLLSMAKIRALRRLWARVLEACSIPASQTTIHAETSYRMMTAKDAETNILRTTIAGFAAAAGGADSLSILPHSIALGVPNAFARRIARNTQLILARESHIDFVGDPASGAGGVEALTTGLCEAAWAEFQTIEKEGGLLRSLAAGLIQQRIGAAREARAEAYRSGKRTLVGTTIFPLEKERRAAILPASRYELASSAGGVLGCERLMATRIDETLGAAA